MLSDRLQPLVSDDPSSRAECSPAATQDHTGDTLPDLLASLKYLDLTGSVRRKEGGKGIGRGYYDVYVGYYLQRNGNSPASRKDWHIYLHSKEIIYGDIRAVSDFVSPLSSIANFFLHKLGQCTYI